MVNQTRSNHIIKILSLSSFSGVGVWQTVAVREYNEEKERIEAELAREQQYSDIKEFEFNKKVC